MSKRILVVGGAGYIGSHMVLQLQEAGLQPLVYDNLSTGHRDAVLDAELIVGDMADKTKLSQVFSTHEIDAVMHFASHIEVGESVQKPLKYYANNVSATITLLGVMQEFGVKNFIFSSTAAVYGNPQTPTITEDHATNPINPYGHSKLMVEQIVKDLAQQNMLNYFIFRYFNAAGADPKGRLAERHRPESHLIPIILQVASGARESLNIYGSDYPTPDGTCIRDYVHVTDLCSAHLTALKQLLKNKNKNQIYNLGNGSGYSVLEVVNTARKITSKKIAIIKDKRRAGDPAVLVANASKAVRELDWKLQFNDIETILAHAWHVCTKKILDLA